MRLGDSTWGRGNRLSAMALAMCAVLSLSACGGSNDEEPAEAQASAAPTSSTTDETEATPTPTPTAPEKKADKKTQKLAALGILRTKDFGAEWKEHTAGTTPAQDVWGETCESTEGGLPNSFRTGAVENGPIMQLKKGTAFVSSFSYALPSDKAAKKLIDVANSEQWVECKRQELLTFLEGQDLKKTKVVVDPEKASTLGQSGFESETTFLYKDKGEVTAYVQNSFYRLEKVVILVQREVGFTTDPQFEAFQDGIHEALTKAYDRVYKVL